MRPTAGSNTFPYSELREIPSCRLVRMSGGDKIIGARRSKSRPEIERLNATRLKIAEREVSRLRRRQGPDSASGELLIACLS
jgi:hypothetical protein